VLPDIILRWRNKLLSNPDFLDVMQKLPITRLVARRRSRQLFDIVAGFTYSQVLYACVSLNVFAHVSVDGITSAELAQRIGWSVPDTERLVDAASALGLLEGRERILLGRHGAALLGQPWIAQFVLHHRDFYSDLRDPASVLQRKPGEMRRYWAYENAAADRSAYSALMAASQAAVSREILSVFDFASAKTVLDVGGGSGAFLKAVGARRPQLERHLFDLPGVVGLGQHASITSHSGDFRSDLLPAGMDVVTLVRVLHDHDDDDVLALLRNVRRSMTVSNRLLVAEPFAGLGGLDAYFATYFGAMGQGRLRRVEEIKDLAAKAGFGNMKRLRTNMPLITGVILFTAT
jgi:demethylspheroidene O-methyltransferase